MARAGRAGARAGDRPGADRARGGERAGDQRRVNVLGFDTSTAATSVCLLRADGEAFEVEPPVERLYEPPGHARELMPGVDRVLREAGLGYGDVDVLAVFFGHGAFT